MLRDLAWPPTPPKLGRVGIQVSFPWPIATQPRQIVEESLPWARCGTRDERAIKERCSIFMDAAQRNGFHDRRAFESVATPLIGRDGADALP